MFRIRRPVESDIPWLATQLRSFDNFFNAKHSLVPAGEGELERRLADLLGQPDLYPWWLAERATDGPVGFIAGVLHPHFFNPEVTCLSELFWWVAPEHRQTRAGWMLLSTFTMFGHGAANLIIMTLEADSPVKYGTLERLGYRVKETNFLLEVK